MPLKSKDKRTFIDSVKDCIHGMNYIFDNENNFKREIFLALIALILCYLLKVSKIEFIIVLIVIALVLVSEVFNTAIEKVVDLYTKEYNTLAGTIKDISAFGVFLMSFIALIIGIIIFGSKIYILIGGL